MLEHALAGDRLIAMAVLAPGWEADYDGRPPLWTTGCLGRIAVHHRLDGGEYNVLLVGLCRVRLVQELPAAKSFREAQVEICEDRYPTGAKGSTADLRGRLRREFFRILPDLPQAQDQLDQLLTGDLPLGTLTDIISYMLDIDLDRKEALLAETNVHRRAELLLAHLSRTAASDRSDPSGIVFPPQFSLN